MKKEYKDEIKSLVNGHMLFDEPLKKYISFKIGGKAEVLIEPFDVADLQRLITYLYQKQIDYHLLGHGTNLLISDQGLEGVTIKLAKSIDKLEVKGNNIVVEAGASLPKIARLAQKRGLSGLEFACGIPATLGGAVVMNAGADGHSLGDLITKLKVLDVKGRIRTYSKEELQFSYRKTKFQENKEIILEIELELSFADRKEIEQKMNELLEKRKKTQPLSYPNAGSIFKNPSGDWAGRLIEQAACKGMKIGDAQVSTKHANFIVNLGDAKAKEVLRLIEKVKKVVYDKFGVRLETELKFLGFR